MPFVPQYHPVTRPLYLREYAQAYGDQHLDVWVNPPAEFRAKHSALLDEFLRRTVSVETARDAAGRSQESQPAADLMREIDEYNRWTAETFIPQMDEWYAELYSQNGETWTAEEVHTFIEIDEALSNWIRRKSLDLITEHRTGKKKV